MPPRGRSIADFGAVAEHGNGWRARLQLDGKKSDGPQRATRAEAQEDLHGARQRNSRLEMKLYLLSLGKQAGEHVASEASGVAKSAEARGDADEAHASDEIAPNKPPATSSDARHCSIVAVQQFHQIAWVPCVPEIRPARVRYSQC